MFYECLWRRGEYLETFGVDWGQTGRKMDLLAIVDEKEIGDGLALVAVKVLGGHHYAGQGAAFNSHPGTYVVWHLEKWRDFQGESVYKMTKMLEWPLSKNPILPGDRPRKTKRTPKSAKVTRNGDTDGVQRDA